MQGNDADRFSQKDVSLAKEIQQFFATSNLLDNTGMDAVTSSLNIVLSGNVEAISKINNLQEAAKPENIFNLLFDEISKLIKPEWVPLMLKVAECCATDGKLPDGMVPFFGSPLELQAMICVRTKMVFAALQGVFSEHACVKTFLESCSGGEVQMQIATVDVVFGDKGQWTHEWEGFISGTTSGTPISEIMNAFGGEVADDLLTNLAGADPANGAGKECEGKVEPSEDPMTKQSDAPDADADAIPDPPVPQPPKDTTGTANGP